MKTTGGLHTTTLFGTTFYRHSYAINVFGQQVSLLSIPLMCNLLFFLHKLFSGQL